MTRTVYPDKAETVKETPEQKRTARALSLYDAGYRAHAYSDGEIVITTPKGGAYTVNPATPSCDCRAYAIALRRGDPTCKHIEGAELLAIRSERLPLTEEQILAISNRNLRFMAEFPVIVADFDNGVNRGQLRLTGHLYQAGRLILLAKRMDGDAVYRISPDDVKIDGLTSEHLTRVAEYVAAWHKAGPLTGHVRQGDARNWTGSSYR